MPGLTELTDNEDEIKFKEGDHLFTVSMGGTEMQGEHIYVTETILQCLVQAHTWNVNNDTPKGFQEVISPQFHDFEDVFVKESFDSLSGLKKWDHVIELLPGTECKFCEVYPMSPNEQMELDHFLDENLKSGCICSFKLPMASPIFFIKKKDGSLYLIQNYCMLNAIILKNHYPLPLVSEIMNNL